MNIQSIGTKMSPTAVAKTDSPQGAGGFGETIKNAVNDVNKTQTEADQMATRLASGDAVEVHQAMIAMQKASQALNLTIQVRNKVIDAYQEIMRTQV
jgi:flagellar hook-basal body complex protein FliE